METALRLAGALLVLQPARPGPARALYVRDDGPAGHDEPYHKMPAHKMYYISNNSQKNMKLVNERAVDSYFRILRATPQSLAAAVGERRSSPPPRVAADTEPPKQHRRVVEPTAYAPRNDPKKNHEKTTSGLNQIAKRKDEELLKPNRKEYFRKHSVYEKHTVVSKGNKRKNRRPHRAQHFHQKMYLSQVRDQILHKANANGDRRARLLADAAHTVIDKHSRDAKENRKRNTIDRESSPLAIHGQNDNRLSSPNYMRATEDMYQKGEGAHRLGRHEAESEGSPPYALFYRSHDDAPPLDARAALEESADGAYYRGSASSYVDLNVGRKATPLQL